MKARGRVTPPESATPDRRAVFSARPLVSHRSVSGNLPNVQRTTLIGAQQRTERPKLPSVLPADGAEPNNARHFQLRHGPSSVCLRRVRYKTHTTGTKKSVPRPFVRMIP